MAELYEPGSNEKRATNPTGMNFHKEEAENLSVL